MAADLCLHLFFPLKALRALPALHPSFLWRQESAEGYRKKERNVSRETEKKEEGGRGGEGNEWLVCFMCLYICTSYYCIVDVPTSCT